MKNTIGEWLSNKIIYKIFCISCNKQTIPEKIIIKENSGLYARIVCSRCKTQYKQ